MVIIKQYLDRPFECLTWGMGTSAKSALSFCATICKTVRPMLSDRCPVCPVLSCLWLWCTVAKWL